MKNKFFCNECGAIVDELVDSFGYLCCPECEYEIFESVEELREYLDYPEPTHIEPFETPNREKEIWKE